MNPAAKTAWRFGTMKMVSIVTLHLHNGYSASIGVRSMVGLIRYSRWLLSNLTHSMPAVSNAECSGLPTTSDLTELYQLRSQAWNGERRLGVAYANGWKEC